MSDRVKELADRESMLRLRCAAQRSAIAREVASVETRLATVDRVATTVRRIVTHPAAIGAGMLVVILLGRARTFRLLGQGLLLANAARRLMRASGVLSPRS
jgi:YqjK-like protein